VRGNTAHRLRLTLQGGCSTPRLIPLGRAVSRPAPPTRALLRLPGAVAFSGDKGHSGREPSALPSRPSHRPAFLPRGSRQQCPPGTAKGRLPLSPLDTPSTARPALGRHHRARRHMRASEASTMSPAPDGCHRTHALHGPPSHPGSHRCSHHRQTLRKGQSGSLWSLRPAPDSPSQIFVVPRGNEGPPALLPNLPARPCLARRLVRRTI